VTPGEQLRFLARSDGEAAWEQRVLSAWREGFFFGAKSRADDYDRGFHDGLMAYKAAQHDIVRLLELEMARWGGWREGFGKPRPGDYPGSGNLDAQG
jgi:hypothetical protein